MTRNAKRWLAMGLAVMVGCMIPMGTMKASEEKESVSQNSIVVEEQQETPEAVPEPILQMTVVEQNEQTIGVPMQTEASGVQFSYQQNDLTGAFGSIVSSDVYIGMNGAHALTVSISNGFYCLLQDIKSVTQQDLEKRSDWKEIQGGQISLEGMQDGKYVACIKAGQSEETIYAVSKSFVWDTTPPRIIDESGKDMNDAGNYAADTKFTVTDLSPVTVYLNDDRSAPIQPVDGKYVVVPRANSTSCTIIAIDKAGNEKSINLNIEGGSTPPEPEEPAANTITESKTYTLQGGTAYTLGAGSWKVDGDSSVYPGGITFYVPSGDYNFQKQ